MGLVKVCWRLLLKGLNGTVRKVWYQKAHRFKFFLMIFVPFYYLIIRLRRLFLTQAVKRYRSKSVRRDVPVIVVGNITVGGTGKTPLVITLAKCLQARGYRPGIVTRGYGGQRKKTPYLVTDEDDPLEVGDEPLLLMQKTQAPVVISAARQRGVEMLSQRSDVSVILSDDGLQHYTMPRDIEIAVVDNWQWFGNGILLPAGPLREPKSRLSEVDFIVVNNATGTDDINALIQQFSALSTPWIATRIFKKFKNIALDIEVPITAFAHHRAYAYTAIGNPAAFFDGLNQLKIEVLPQAFYDHYLFTEEDFELSMRLPIIMTEKDAVKCAAFANQRMWALQTEFMLRHEQASIDQLIEKIRRLQ